MTRRKWQLFSRLLAGLDSVTPVRLYLICLISVLLVLHGVAPQDFRVDGTSIGLLGVIVVVSLVVSIHHP
jgi:hypothetical protein